MGLNNNQRTIYVGPEEWRRWVVQTMRRGVSVSQAIREAMDLWLAAKKAKK